MYQRLIVFLFLAFIVALSNACTSEDTDVNDGANEQANTNENVDSNSLATNGCQNVVIVNNFAYASCGNGIEVVSLQTLERSFLNFSADDITADADLGLLFTQSGGDLRVLDLTNPIPYRACRNCFNQHKFWNFLRYFRSQWYSCCFGRNRWFGYPSIYLFCNDFRFG